MNKIVVTTFLSLFPILALATGGSLTFAPPAGDYSVVFLGNVFGVVDGVLHGTGSQIMGNMFGVFNAAVLALGGIVIMYTLMVSTVNTVHEGTMLGQKWSSIWVPTRATLGLALLIPKASGYCLMQIFVMWVVVQGVGAADKIWEAALSYLNRGGVIVQAQINPIALVTGGNSSVAKGASAILAGQTCMLGIQQILTNQLKGYQNSVAHKSGPCSGTPTGAMLTFCNATVPDFISSVNFVAIQSAKPDSETVYNAPMPNFDPSSEFAPLNGVCGNIQWKPFSSENLATIKDNISGLSASEIATAKMSRAIAIQQMYQDLQSIAQVAVNNDPQLNPPASSGNATATPPTPFSVVAQEQFGVPYLSSGNPCTSPDKNCITWGQDPSGKSAPLYEGTEFQDALSDYQGIMAPTLNLYSRATKGSSANTQRAFITGAVNQGWLMAGSYFYDLAQLNSSTASVSSGGANQLTDLASGLENSAFIVATPPSAFQNGKCTGQYANLCIWLGGNVTQINQVISLINGAGLIKTPLTPPTFSSVSQTAVAGVGSSTIYGYITNASMVNLPGQPGMVPPTFGMIIKPDFSSAAFDLPVINFPCNWMGWVFICLGSILGDVIYNLIIVNLWNLLVGMFIKVVNFVVMMFLSIPLMGMAMIFNAGVAFIQQPNINPVVALAAMGVNYINFASELWIFLLELAIISAILPLFGLFVFPLLALSMPLLMAWLGTMVAIGFLTAYYIPFLPYMIFTFGSIAWLMAVVEAMVAAPIVALGVTHPEGEGPFGKGEQAIMILMNVFLRPAMMIIGYIAGITLSYVSVWMINAGFGNVVSFINGSPGGTGVTLGEMLGQPGNGMNFNVGNFGNDYLSGSNVNQVSLAQGYTGWAGIYGFFFSILVYTTMYITVVQKAFTLIVILPDKVLRWIGGQPESVGQEAASWGDESKQQVTKAGEGTFKASGQMDKQLTGYGEKGISAAKAKPPSSTSTGSTSTPSVPE